MKIVEGYAFTYGYIILIMLIVSLMKKKWSLKEITARKIIHIMVGFSWFIMIYYFKTSWHLVIPLLTFIFINYIVFMNQLGTIYYALGFTILAFITVLFPSFLPIYGISILTMSLGDGLAPFLGSSAKYKIEALNKTYVGTFTVILSSLIVCLLFNNYYSLDFSIIEMIIMSFSAGILELVDYKSLDNLTLPLGMALIAKLLIL